MKIRLASIGKNMGWKHCLFEDHFSIRRFWGDKIINIGFSALYLVIDLRKNWYKDMITGIIE